MKKDLLNKIGAFSLSFFVAASAAYLYSPVIKTNADESATLTFETTVNPIASLSLDTNELVFNILPTAEGVFDSKSLTATVDTNSMNGYELYFSSVDNETNLTHANSDISDVVASDFSGSVTSSTMDKNKWGFSLDNTDFSKIPTLSAQTAIRNINHYPTSAEKDTTVYIGTKISTAISSGRYSKDIIFSVIAHDNTTTDDDCDNIFCLEELQKMTPEICANTTTPLASAREVTFEDTSDNTKIPRTRMRDNRDNKVYLVSKFADGKCWMSQSLELELSTGTTLTSENTDLNSVSSWTPAYSTFENYSDLEDLSLQHSGWDRAYSVKPAIKYLRNGTTASETPSTDDGKSEWEKVGYFYNWIAATATSIQEDIVNFNSNDVGAKDSICPKGWRLPMNTTYNRNIKDVNDFRAAYGTSLNPFSEAFAFIASGDVSVTGPYNGIYRASAYDVGTYGYFASNHGRSYYSQGDYVEPRANTLDSYSTVYGALVQVRCIAREE